MDFLKLAYEVLKQVIGLLTFGPSRDAPLLGNGPGGLVYHLVLLFAFMAAAAIAFGRLRKGGAEARLFWAAAALFGVRLVGLLAAFLGLAAVPGLALNPHWLIPPLDRAISALTILLILWAFAFPKPARLADVVTAGLALAILIALGMSWGVWLQELPSILSFNSSPHESVWEGAQIALLVVGAVLLVIRRQANWPIGLGLVLLLLVGHGLEFSPSFSGDVPGVVRLAEIVALPMFTALVYRSMEAPQPVRSAAAAMQLPAPAAFSPSAINSRALLALATLSATSDLEERRQNLTLALACLFQADLALLVLPPDKSGAAPVACCYRVARGMFVARPDLPIKEFAAVSAALNGGEAALLPFDQHEVELRRLAAGTGLEGIGSALVAPLMPDRETPLGAVVLLAAPARPAWTADDRQLFSALMRALAAAFETVDDLASVRQECQAQQRRADCAEVQRRVVQETAEKLMTELAEAQGAVLQLTEQARQAQSRVPEAAPGPVAPAEAKDLAELRAQLAEAQRQAEDRNRLEVELEAALESGAGLAVLETQIKALSDEVEELRRVRATLEGELGRTQAELEQAEMQLAAAGESPEATEAQTQQFAQLRLELELARMELQQTAERQAALREQTERDQQTLTQEAQTALAAVQAELEKKEATLQQLAEWRQLREGEFAAELEQARGELHAALGQQAELQSADENWQRLFQEVQTALAEKETSLQQRAEEHQQREAALSARLEQLNAERQQHEAALTADLEHVRAELQQAVELRAALEQADQHQKQLEQEAQAALAAMTEKAQGLQQRVDQSTQREAELLEQISEQTLDLECLRAELQEAQSRQTALDQAKQNQQALAQEAQTALTTVQTALAEKALELQQTAERAAQRETELAAQVAALTAALEHSQAELQETLTQAQSTQATLEQEVRAALMEKTQGLQQLVGQHAEREADLTTQVETLTAALEQTRTELQQALQQVGQADSQHQAMTQEMETALLKVQGDLAEKVARLHRLTEEHQRRETDWTGALEQARGELQQALEREAALEQTAQAHQTHLQETQSALNMARAAIGGQAATMVSTQERLAGKERELAEAQAALQAARQAELPPPPQTTLETVAGLTQDLRQPIMSISGYVSLLLGESVGLVGAVQKKFLERIQVSCERLETLLNDLTQTTDAVSTGQALKLGAVDVSRLVAMTVQDNDALLREKGIRLRQEVSDNLPPMQADPTALNQVLEGLLHNAAKASALNGEVVLTVRRESQTTKEDGRTDCVFIAVKDSGSGINADDLPKVFLNLPKAEPRLAGLGDTPSEVAALRPLVEAHHGRIWVTSTPGQGSLFSVLLPVTESPEAPAEDATQDELAEPPLPVTKAIDFLVLPPD